MEEIRVPPGYRGAASPEGAGDRGAHVGNGLGSSNGGGQRGVGGEESGIGTLHPFEESVHLLRRCTSEQELDAEGDEDDDEFPEQVNFVVIQLRRRTIGADLKCLRAAGAVALSTSVHRVLDHLSSLLCECFLYLQTVCKELQTDS